MFYQWKKLQDWDIGIYLRGYHRCTPLRVLAFSSWHKFFAKIIVVRAKRLLWRGRRTSSQISIPRSLVGIGVLDPQLLGNARSKFRSWIAGCWKKNLKSLFLKDTLRYRQDRYKTVSDIWEREPHSHSLFIIIQLFSWRQCDKLERSSLGSSPAMFGSQEKCMIAWLCIYITYLLYELILGRFLWLKSVMIFYAPWMLSKKVYAFPCQSFKSIECTFRTMSIYFHTDTDFHYSFYFPRFGKR